MRTLFRLNLTFAACAALSAVVMGSACDPQAPAEDEGALEVDSLSSPLIGRPPSLTKVEPALGPDSGFITVTLTGKNFRPGATVSFGGALSSTVKVESSTKITASVPSKPGTLGRVPVRITQPDGRFVERNDLFAYYSDSIAFRTPNRYAAGFDPSFIVTADFNKDGRLDFATASSGSNAIAIGLGKAGGGFESDPTLKSQIECSPFTSGYFDVRGKRSNILTYFRDIPGKENRIVIGLAQP